MSLTCRDILALPYANQCKLLAGKSGLGNVIRWPHYLEEPSYTAYLRGGELIITAGVVTGSDPKTLEVLLEDLFDKEAAGVMISLSDYIPKVPKELIALCNRLGLPLFELPAHVRIVDINQSIGRAVLEQKQRVDDISSILLDLVQGRRVYEKRLLRLNDQHFIDEAVLRVVYFQIEEFARERENFTAPDLNGEFIYEEDFIEDQYVQEVFDLIRTIVTERFGQAYMAAENGNIYWIPEIVPGVKISPTLKAILNLLGERLPEAKMRIGVSEEFSNIRVLDQKVGHASDALRLSSRLSSVPQIMFYEDMVSYRMFRMINSREKLKKMERTILRDLTEPGNRELLDTLLCYIRNECKAKQTAEALYIHINTMHYRLNKIQTILNRDLGHMDDLLDVMLALKMHDYLQDES